jgi:diadenosine tetraphosphate (Ap4A) HIT family hydrolase
MTTPAPLLFADSLLTIEMSQECAIPGYLVLRLRPPGATLPGLDPAAAGRLGTMLTAAARAIERAVGTERVYVLSFCEVEPQLHFHLFPRTRWLLQAFAAATGASGPPSGPALFEWARRTFPPGAALPPGVPAAADAAARLRAALASVQVT